MTSSDSKSGRREQSRGTQRAWAHTQLPDWLSGGNPVEFLQAARLRRRVRKDGGWSIRPERSVSGSPELVGALELLSARYPWCRRRELEAILRAEPPSVSYADQTVELDLARYRLRGRLEADPSDISARVSLWQLDAVTCSQEQLPEVLEAIYGFLRGTVVNNARWYTDGSIHVLYRTNALALRARLVTVLLQWNHTSEMQTDIQPWRDRLATGSPVLTASEGLLEGLRLFDVYGAPLLGSMTPFIWAVPLTRSSGIFVVFLAKALNGFLLEPRDLMGAIQRPLTVSRPPVRPELSGQSGTAAIHWWAKALDDMFGWLSDPAVFTDPAGVYQPQEHLHWLLTVEQIFQRVGSIQRGYRDAPGRLAAMFDVFDSLMDRLEMGDMEVLTSMGHAQQVFDSLRSIIPSEAHPILLSGAERAVAALESLQSGFLGVPGVPSSGVLRLAGPDGDVDLPYEKAVSAYLLLLRNATHGFGGLGPARKNNRLLVHHDGHVDNDVALLAYLYLLDMLANPDRSRATVSARVSRMVVSDRQSTQSRAPSQTVKDVAAECSSEVVRSDASIAAVGRVDETR